MSENVANPTEPKASQPPPAGITRHDLLMARVQSAVAHISRETTNPTEAASIAMAALGYFAMAMYPGNVERAAKQLQECKNRIVADMRRAAPRGKGPR